MKNINDKIKKNIIVASGLVICIVLILMINSKFQKEPINEVLLPNEKDNTSDIVVKAPEDVIVITPPKDKEKEIIVPPIKIPDKQPTDKGAVDKGTEQTIQGDVKKPEEPTKEQLTDPTQKPNGEKVEKPTEPPKNSDEPKGGDINDKGQIYVPGFGWIEDIGEGEGTTAEDMYENGNKIGIMD